MTFRGYDAKSQAQGWFKHKHKRKHKHKCALTSSLNESTYLVGKLEKTGRTRVFIAYPKQCAELLCPKSLVVQRGEVNPN